MAYESSSSDFFIVEPFVNNRFAKTWFSLSILSISRFLEPKFSEGLSVATSWLVERVWSFEIDWLLGD